jgi:hypothetical protein
MLLGQANRLESNTDGKPTATSWVRWLYDNGIILS